MRLDSHSFELTAQAVWLLNDSIKSRFNSSDDLLSYMESMAWSYMNTSASFSTAGFELTAFESSVNGERVVRASVCAFTVMHHHGRKEERSNGSHSPFINSRLTVGLAS